MERIAALKEAFESQDHGRDELDLTRTAYPIGLGTRHPLSIVKDEIIDIFARMGFNIADGPEVEDDLHVYTKLNFAADHPARDMQDTFFVEVNRTMSHATSSCVRTPAPCKCARWNANSSPSASFARAVSTATKPSAIAPTASSTRWKPLYIDKGVSFTDLKQVLLLFAREMFGSETKIRLRPSYFPFTEPSAEMDISCNICGGKGCPFCKGTGWVEILGCGMVDPNVLEACGIDSRVYSGYALGNGH